jgi:hypothetical protein
MKAVPPTLRLRPSWRSAIMIVLHWSMTFRTYVQSTISYLRRDQPGDHFGSQPPDTATRRYQITDIVAVSAAVIQDCFSFW